MYPSCNIIGGTFNGAEIESGTFHSTRRPDPAELDQAVNGKPIATQSETPVSSKDRDDVQPPSVPVGSDQFHPSIFHGR